jgi:NitT/TauT family transport system ATP-binding protein
MTQAIELPSYREQSPEVAQRFGKLKERPVLLEVKNLVKTFQSASGLVTALDKINFVTYRS